MVVFDEFTTFYLFYFAIRPRFHPFFEIIPLYFEYFPRLKVVLVGQFWHFFGFSSPFFFLLTILNVFSLVLSVVGI